MSTVGTTPRKIKITVSDMDAFSDEIKVSGLIDEIETAEINARKALLERQIKESQPRMKLHLPKLTLPRLSLSKITLPKASLPKRAIKSKVPRESIFTKFNALAPNGVEIKTLVTICISAAALVTATELGIWAYTHKSEVQEVPKTGVVIEEESDSEPEKTEVKVVEPATTTEDAQTEEVSTPSVTPVRTSTARKQSNNTSANKPVVNTGISVDSNTIYTDSSLSGNETVKEVVEPDRQPKDTIIYYEPSTEEPESEESGETAEE